MPKDKIISRYYRSLANLPVFAKRATVFRVYDNSDSNEEKSPNVLAVGKNGKLLYADPAGIPHVIEQLRPLAPSGAE